MIFGFMHISCLVHGLHGVWCLSQGWDNGTLGNTLSGRVTLDPRVARVLLSTPLILANMCVDVDTCSC